MEPTSPKIVRKSKRADKIQNRRMTVKGAPSNKKKNKVLI